MPRLLVALMLLPFVLAACSDGDAPLSDDQQAFLDTYQAYCGAAYAGESRHVDLGDESPLIDADLQVTFETCSDEAVRAPFYVDDDTSRTWTLDVVEEGLRLAHDHRHPDGSEYEANMYGGLADEQGSTTKQFFSADARTIDDRPSRDINVWSKEFDLANERYYYRLYLDDELAYEAAFDLSAPLTDD